jgi:hypothetical protein
MAKGVAFSLADMKALWKSSKVRVSRGRNDRIEKNKGGVTYYLFGNEIAHYNPMNGTLTLSDAGWETTTTKDRLNGLGANILQKDFTWYTSSQGKRVLWPGTKIIKV